MPKSNRYSTPSFGSRGIISLNSVHPEEKDANFEHEANRSSPEDLFLAKISKARKSFFIEITPQRVIHVQQYTQKTEDLLDENNPEKNPTNRNTAIVLFLIHGVGGSSDMWDPQIQYFINEGYEIVSLDLLGHGLSSKPSGYKAYGFKELANDVLHIFDMFCKHRNVLIGHSYGSSFCTLLSKERGSVISKVVLIGGGGPTTLMPESCSAFCLPLPLFFFIRPTLIKMFRRMAFHVDTSETIRKKITTFGISSHTLKAIMQGQVWPDADEQYHADLLVPVLLIYGRGDQFVSLEDEIWMQETIYGSELEIIDNAGHMVMIEAPTIVNQVLHTFMNRDPSTRLNNESLLKKKEAAQDEEIEPAIEPADQEFSTYETSCISPNDYSQTPETARRSSSRMQSQLSMRAGSRMSQSSMRGSKYRRKTMF